MVIWKERQHELDGLQAKNDPMTVRALHECGLLKFFRILGMRAYVHLLVHMIRIWDLYQQHFVVGTHDMMIDVENIYFLTGLLHRGILVVLIDPRGGEQSVDDLIDDHYSAGTHTVGGKIPINHIVYRPSQLRRLGAPYRIT